MPSVGGAEQARRGRQDVVRDLCLANSINPLKEAYRVTFMKAIALIILKHTRRAYQQFSAGVFTPNRLM